MRLNPVLPERDTFPTSQLEISLSAAPANGKIPRAPDISEVRCPEDHVLDPPVESANSDRAYDTGGGE